MPLRNIYLDEKTFDRLKAFKGKEMSYSDVINQLLDETLDSPIEKDKKKNIPLEVY
jgi:predicted CopG family antitoxin